MITRLFMIDSEATLDGSIEWSLWFGDCCLWRSKERPGRDLMNALHHAVEMGMDYQKEATNAAYARLDPGVFEETRKTGRVRMYQQTFDQLSGDRDWTPR